MSKIYLNIGSNLGNRALNIETALSSLADLFGDKAESIRLAPLTVSKPFGYQSDNEYYNLGLEIDTGSQAMDPAEVLALTQQAERSVSTASHRNADGTYRDRLIDIDILEIDNHILATPQLTLPHPGIAERPFFAESLEWLKQHSPVSTHDRTI